MSILSQIYSEGGDALKNYFEVSFEGMPPPVYSTYEVYNPMFTGGSYAGNTLDKRTDLKVNGGFQDNNVVIRVKNVSLPTYAVKTADINFYTTQIRVPVAKMEFTPEFTITFRVDQDWALYQALIKWRNTIFDVESGYVKFDSTNPVYLLLNNFLHKGLNSESMSLVGRCNAVTITALQKSIGAVDKYYIKQVAKNVTEGTRVARDAQKEAPLRIWRFRGAYPTKVDGISFDYSGSEAQEVTVTFSYLDMSEYYQKDEENDTNWGN